MDSFYDSVVLLGQIELKKREMYAKAIEYGLSDPRVVICSQELDELLNRYQSIKEVSLV